MPCRVPIRSIRRPVRPESGGFGRHPIVIVVSGETIRAEVAGTVIVVIRYCTLEDLAAGGGGEI